MDALLDRLAGISARLHRTASALARVADEWLVSLSRPVPSWPSAVDVEQARAQVRELGERLDAIDEGLAAIAEARKERSDGELLSVSELRGSPRHTRPAGAPNVTTRCAAGNRHRHPPPHRREAMTVYILSGPHYQYETGDVMSVHETLEGAQVAAQAAHTEGGWEGRIDWSDRTRYWSGSARTDSAEYRINAWRVQP